MKVKNIKKQLRTVDYLTVDSSKIAPPI